METTVILLVSKKDHLAQMFARLELLKCDKKKTNLLVYVDGPLTLFQSARNYTVNSKFNQKLCVNRNKGQPDVSNQRKRRRRIADIHNEIKEHIANCDYVFLVEDDTLLPTNALDKLIGHALIDGYAGFISGVQLGRHGFLHVGAWKVDSVYEPYGIESTGVDEGLQPVDAAGLYCCLIKKDLYMAHHFEPFEKILGPDVDLGIKLRQQGYQNYVDYSIKCGHMNKKETIEFHNSEIVQVKFVRTDDRQYKFGWIQSTNVPVKVNPGKI